MHLGIAGQCLTLAAMVVPILLRETEQVLVLVFASAVAGLLVNPGMLAFQFVFPVVRGPRMLRVATGTSLLSLGVVSAAVLTLTPLEPLLDVPRGTFSAVAAITAAWGCYSIVGTRLVRAGDVTGIGLSRLYYGVAALTASLVASLVELGPLALSYGTGISYLAAALALAPRRSHRNPALPSTGAAGRRRLRRAYLARAGRPALASLANGWTTLVPGLVLPGLGAAGEPWAIVCRICGGFATVLMALVAPPLAIRQSRAVRLRQAAEYATARRTGLQVGAAAAVVGVASGLALALYSTDATVGAAWFPTIAVAAVLYWGSLLAGTLVDRLPNFLGRDTARLFWDAGRAAVLTLVFFLVDGTLGLITMGVAMALSSLLLLPMTRWQRTA